MNSLQIKCFLTLAQTGSYAKAEDLLFLSSQSVRKHVFALETELGLKLFKSQKSSLILTEMGEMFFRFFSLAKNEYQIALANAREQQCNNFPVSISILEGLETIDGLLDPLFSAETKQPLSYNINYRPFTNILTNLANGGIHLAIMLNFPGFLSQIKIKGLQMSLLHREALELYYSENSHNIWQDNAMPKIDDFKNSTFFLPQLFNTSYNKIPQKLNIPTWIDHLSFVPHTELADSLNKIILLVSNGEGVTVAPSHSRIKRESYIKSIPIDYELEIILVWLRQNGTPILQDLINSCSENF